MDRSGFSRSIRVGCCFVLAVAWLAQAQGGKISFSVLNEDDIVHVSQIDFQPVRGELTVVSTFGITNRKELRVPSGQAFERTVFLSNETPQAQEFLLVLILDDQQVPFRLDGAEDVRHTVALEANEQRRLRWSFPSISATGLHNFVLIAFYDVEFGDDTPMHGIFTPYADGVIVGSPANASSSIGRPQPEEFVQGQTVAANRTVPPKGISLSRIAMPNSENDLLASPLRLSAGQELNYYINVRNGRPLRDDIDEFALLALLDGVQIPIHEANGLTVAHFTLPLNGMVSLPARLAAPDEAGPHALDVLAVRNPYDSLGALGSLEVLHHRVSLNVN